MNNKRVNVFTNVAIENTSVPILSSLIDISLSLDDIRQCINQLAEVYEIIGKNKVVRLNLSNYDKDNGDAPADVNPLNNYNITVIKLVNDIPGAGYSNVLYIDSQLRGWVWDKTNLQFRLVMPHVSNEIIDGIVDNNPVTGESVKNYLTKKLNEMKDINVEGKADKLLDDKHDEILSATADGNIQATGYKLNTENATEEDPDSKLVINKKDLKDAFKWDIIQ